MLSVFHKSKPFLSLSTSATRSMASSSASNKKLDGKVAIVTAATEGIGFAIARRLAQDGASVVLSSRKQENVDKAVKQLKDEGLDVDGIQCHVGREDHRNNLIEHTVKSKGGIDILVSNAAANPAMGPTLDCSESVWDKLFEINVKAAFLLSKLVVPEMEKRKGGSIVYISSIGGYQPLPAIGPYCVTKTALLGLTKALAIELAYSNIRVNCVAPGVIKTKFSQQLTDVAPEMALERIPLNRFGEPKEVASVVSFLCSDDASYITGESIAPAGGYYSRL